MEGGLVARPLERTITRTRNLNSRRVIRRFVRQTCLLIRPGGRAISPPSHSHALNVRAPDVLVQLRLQARGDVGFEHPLRERAHVQLSEDR